MQPTPVYQARRRAGIDVGGSASRSSTRQRRRTQCSLWGEGNHAVPRYGEEGGTAGYWGYPHGAGGIFDALAAETEELAILNALVATLATAGNPSLRDRWRRTRDLEFRLVAHLIPAAELFAAAHTEYDTHFGYPTGLTTGHARMAATVDTDRSYLTARGQTGWTVSYDNFGDYDGVVIRDEEGFGWRVLIIDGNPLDLVIEPSDWDLPELAGQDLLTATDVTTLTAGGLAPEPGAHVLNSGYPILWSSPKRDELNRDNPFASPTPIQDCHRAWTWIRRHADNIKAVLRDKPTRLTMIERIV